MPCLNPFNCWKPLRADKATAKQVIAGANAKNLSDWAISSQASWGRDEGSTTRTIALEQSEVPRMGGIYSCKMQNFNDINNYMAEKKFFISKEDLQKAYDELGSMYRVAEKFGVSQRLVFNYVKKYGIKSNHRYEQFSVMKPRLIKLLDQGYSTKDIAESLGVSDVTVRNYAKKVGKKLNDTYHKGYIITHGGYKMLKDDFHPYKDSRGYVREHRLVVEKEIGCYLEPDKIVHHINEDRLDNRIENLQVVTHKEHNHIHKPVLKRWNK